MKRHVPNIITSLNVLSGSVAIIQVSEQNFVAASILILAAAFFDFFDGMAARLLNVKSQVGAELDSLADVISFGLAPAYLIVEWLSIDHSIWYYLPLIMVPFSAYRLAKFNVDTRQTDSFIGLPTPANALLWLSLPLIHWQVEYGLNNAFVHAIEGIMNEKAVVIVLCLFMSFLMVSELPLLSLKFKNLKWKTNQLRFILILLSLINILLLGFAALPIILILYLLLSITHNFSSKDEIQS